jgi:hypothetical protein
MIDHFVIIVRSPLHLVNATHDTCCSLFSELRCVSIEDI